MSKDHNEKILYLINSGRAAEYGITKEHVYNGYTGSGGLHGLKRSEYDSYSEYSEAKKEVENGQFFTSPAICRFIADTLSPQKEDLVADLTCGAGNFFNFFPSESSLYGCEIDSKAYTVARYLYPAANIVAEAIRFMPRTILILAVQSRLIKRATPSFRPRIFRRKSRSLAQRNGRRIFTMLPRSVRFWEKQ